jgi:hypothetical protein
MLKARMNLLHGIHNAQPHAHDPLGVVFVGQRISKVDQQPIAKVLCEIPIVSSDHISANRLVCAHYLTQFFRVEALGERGRTNQITKHDR